MKGADEPCALPLGDWTASTGQNNNLTRSVGQLRANGGFSLTGDAARRWQRACDLFFGKVKREIPLPTHGSIKERCRQLARVESALGRKAGVRMIASSNSRSGYRGFLIIEPEMLRVMDERSRDALMQSRVVVERILADLKLALFKEAKRLGQEEVFVLYWPKYAAPRKEEDSARSTGRQFFDTFDDGSSVWTHESNWKKQD